MNQQLNAIEALSEAIRRLHLNIKGDIAAGRWEAIKIVLAYQKELTDACLDRISDGVDEWEEMQRVAFGLGLGFARDFVHFLKQCRQ